MVLGDSLLRGTTLKDVAIAFVFCVIGAISAIALLVIALTTAAYSQIEFPTNNEGQYGFLMTSVQSRVPLQNSGGSLVTPPPYNSTYSQLSDTGAPIKANAYYGGTVPFSTSRWWSRLITEKSPEWVTTMPYTYSGVFTLYRSVRKPSFAICLSRPYSYFAQDLDASNVCGQEFASMFKTRAHAVYDGAPTCFIAPALWNLGAGRPYDISSEASYSVREVGTMSAEMTYATLDGLSTARITLSQIVPYVVITLAGESATLCLNTFFRDAGNQYELISLFDVMSTTPSPTPTLLTHMVLRTVPRPVELGRTPIGISQTSILRFEVTLNPAAMVTQLVNGEVIITSVTPLTTIRVLPVEYYIADPRITTGPRQWMHIDSRVSGAILESIPVMALRSFVSATSRGGMCTLTYASDSRQPLAFIPSLSMLSVGTISGADALPSLSESGNRWLTPQGMTSVYLATTGSFDVSYPLINPPPFGTFDIYSAFDANSLRRLSFIFNRDFEALSAIDLVNDSFYTSVKKIFTFAQLTYAVFHYPGTVLVNILLPPLRRHLMEVLDGLITSNRAALKLGYSSSLFTIASSDPQYGSSQNTVFGDNHVGQYGMILFTYYIVVSIQPDNSARRYARDRYQSVMVDLMRDFAQPYNTDQYIPSMRHFDFGVGISWQTSSIIEGTSVQVAEVVNGYYACWLVSQLFGDSKLRDFYRAILSIELATHQEYRLTPLTTSSRIHEMIGHAGTLFSNIHRHLIENGVENPGFYSPSGSTVFLIQNGEIVLHGMREQHADYRYLLEFSNPNNTADFSTASFFRPMTPLTMTLVNLSLGSALSAFVSASLEQMHLVGSMNGAFAPRVTDGAASSNVDAYDVSTQLPVTIMTQEQNPSSFMTIQASYLLAAYARNYVENYTWAGANLPPGTCAVINASDLPPHLDSTMQYNRLGFLDSNTVYWMFYVIAAYGPRK